MVVHCLATSTRAAGPMTVVVVVVVAWVVGVLEVVVVAWVVGVLKVVAVLEEEEEQEAGVATTPWTRGEAPRPNTEWTANHCTMTHITGLVKLLLCVVVVVVAVVEEGACPGAASTRGPVHTATTLCRCRRTPTTSSVECCVKKHSASTTPKHLQTIDPAIMITGGCFYTSIYLHLY